MNNNDSSYSNYNLPIFQDDDNIDLKRYLSLFLSNWYWFAIFLFIAFTLAYGINRYSEEVYSISASLLIKDETLGGYSGMEPIFPGAEIYKNQQNLRNEIGKLKSFDLNREVIDSLPEFHIEYVLIGRRGITEQRKYKDFPFMIKYDESLTDKPQSVFTFEILSDSTFTIGIKGVPGSESTHKFPYTISEKDFNISLPSFSFEAVLRDPLSYRFDDSNSNRYNFSFPHHDGLVNEYRGKLQVSPIEEEASLVTLSVTGHVAQQEIDYLNKLMHFYIKRGLEEKNQASKQTILFINEQLSKIVDSLSVAEDSLQSFRLRNRLVDISTEGSSIKSRLEKFGSDKFALEMQKQYFDYLLEYLDSKDQSGDIISPSVMGVNDPLLERLILELATFQQQKSQLGLNLAVDLPAVGLIDQKVGVTKKSIRENIDNSLKNLSLSLEQVNAQISRVEFELTKLPDTEKGLIRIQRKFELNNTVYTYLLEKRAEASITLASNVADNKQVDEAGMYNVIQVKPRKSRNSMIAFILGLIIPMISILTIDYLNNKVIDKKDVEKLTRAPVLGFISHNEQRTETPVISRPSSTLAESFRSVRTSLNFFIGEVKSPVVSITSTVSAEGKTFISMNLAVVTAMLGKKVLLVGLDLRKPKIHKLLEVSNESGMSNYLSGNATFSDVIYETSINNLWYATSGPIPPNPAELIESDKMKKFLDEAKKSFDYIIIDTPPVAIVTDALLVARHVDANIFVVRQRYTSKNTLGLIQEFYENKKMKNLSIIINDISLSGYYGYGLRYGYTMRYGGYAYGYNFYGDYVSARYGYSKENEGYYTNDDEKV